MVVDLHEDIANYYFAAGATVPVEPFDEDVEGRHVDIPKYGSAGVKLVLGSIFPMVSNLNARLEEEGRSTYGEWSPPSVPVSARDVAIEQVKLYHALEERYRDHLRIVRTWDDAETLGSRTGILLHMEGSEALTQPEDLAVFHKLGLRSLGLTWNFDTRYASSCKSRRDHGLTGDGEVLVRLANRLGVMLDLSHAGEKTCDGIMELSESAPFFSHANAKALKDHPRNVRDDLIKRVGKRGGIVGVTFITSCIGEPADAAAVARHAEHISKLGGESVPALGTDYLGVRATPKDLGDISKLSKLGDALAARKLNGKTILHENAWSYIRKQAERWTG